MPWSAGWTLPTAASSGAAIWRQTRRQRRQRGRHRPYRRCGAGLEQEDERAGDAARVTQLRPGGRRGACAARHRPDSRRGCHGRRDGAERIGKVHAADHRWQPGGAQQRRGPRLRAGPDEAVAQRQGAAAAPFDRLRVPGFQPAARPDGGGERLAAARARRLAGQEGPRGRAARARRARPGRTGGELPRPAVRRRTAAGGHRPRRGRGAPAAAGRRALGGARLGQRRGGHAADPCRLQARRGRGGRHPRRAARLVGRPGGVPAGRPGDRPDPARAGPRIAAHAGTGPVSTGLRERPAEAGAANGGVPARRAVIRWSWRMFRREWRQQMLVLALIVVALAATVVGAAVATNTPPPAGAGFGTAQDIATFQPGPHLAGQIAVLQQAVGRVDVIENQAVAIPGSINTYDLRAQDPHGAFGQPMLSLVSGHYPAGPGQVAVTQGVATTFNLSIGDAWHQGGQVRQVTGIVQNPQSLLDEFALVAAGQVSNPSQVTVLFTAPRGKNPASIGSVSQYVVTRQDAAASNPLNPETIVLALATVGMLLIALVAVGGFTVLAQRRLRSLGMLGALGATDRNIRLVVRVNGVLVGIVGAVIGTVLGLAVWLAYRPELQSSAHHLIGPFQLPWVVIGPAIALAVVATYFAASRPARAITRITIVSALSGRPAPPKRVHRSAVPGVISLVVAFLLLTYSGRSNGNGGGALELILGFVALIVAVILLSPLCLARSEE